MSRREKRILGNVIWAVWFTVFCIFMVWAIRHNTSADTFAVAGSDGNGHKYHYVTAYTQTATYEGGGVFLTEDGNEWTFDGEYEVGKSYKMRMHDNGTESIYDDVIMDVY